MDEEVKETLDGNSEQVLNNDEKEQRHVSDYEQKLGLIEKKQSFISTQESTKKVHVVAKMRNETL